MRWKVDGEEHSFGDSRPEIKWEGDRFWIKNLDGWKSAAVLQVGNQTLISYRGRQYCLEQVRSKSGNETQTGSHRILSPMPGLIVSISVEEGEKVAKGQTLLTIEAMKTQIPLTAPQPSKVGKIAVTLGQQVKSNELLAILE